MSARKLVKSEFGLRDVFAKGDEEDTIVAVTLGMSSDSVETRVIFECEVVPKVRCNSFEPSYSCVEGNRLWLVLTPGSEELIGLGEGVETVGVAGRFNVRLLELTG